MMFNSSVICETPSIISSANEKYISVIVSLNDGYEYSDDSMTERTVILTFDTMNPILLTISLRIIRFHRYFLSTA